MAEAMDIPKPKYKAGPVLSNAGWRISKMMEFFTGKRSSITRETAKTANQTYQYANEKLLRKTGIQLIPVKESVEKTARLFLKDQ